MKSRIKILEDKLNYINTELVYYGKLDGWLIKHYKEEKEKIEHELENLKK